MNYIYAAKNSENDERYDLDNFVRELSEDEEKELRKEIDLEGSFFNKFLIYDYQLCCTTEDRLDLFFIREEDIEEELYKLKWNNLKELLEKLIKEIEGCEGDLYAFMQGIKASLNFMYKIEPLSSEDELKIEEISVNISKKTD